MLVKNNNIDLYICVIQEHRLLGDTEGGAASLWHHADLSVRRVPPRTGHRRRHPRN